MLNSKAERITNKIVTECIEFIMQKSSTSHDELVVFLTDLGYGEIIIRNIKTALADKDDIHVKFVMRDNKLFYELCYDKTVDGTRPLAYWNKMILRKCDASEIQRKRKEEDARFKSQYSKLESAIISELSKYDEPVIINKLL